MRAPSDLPRRPRRAQGRGRALLVIGVILLFILITSLRGIASFYTDYLWFDSLGQRGVWSGVLGAKISLALIFIAAFFVLLWVNLFIADRLAPPFRPAGPEEELLERYHAVIRGRAGLVRVLLSLVLALIAGAGVSGEWNSWLLFTHGGEFGIEDAQFGRDISWYVFKLPFLTFVTGWLFAALLIVLIVTAVAHYLNGGIRVQAQRQRVTPQVKAHLSVLLGLIALVKAVDYWLQQFELTVSTNGAIDGAGYTEVKAQLPAIRLLLLISVAAAILFVANIWRRGWVLPVLGVGLWAFVAVLAGGAYPQFVQRFRVQPDEPAKERPYIVRNIEATRDALNLGPGQVAIRQYEPTTDKSKIDLSGNDEVTVQNIRLWDPSAQVSGKTFRQLQGIRDYYRILDVDVDRYEIDGKPTQVVIGARDLNPAGVPQDSWVARHVTYTHGYGVALAPSSSATGRDEPDFVVRDIPVQTPDDVPLENPRIYFGEDLGGYIVVGEGQDEVDFQAQERTRFTSYAGEDGVRLGSIFRRAAFALRFGDINPLISDFVDNDSKVVFQRDIRDRVETLAPFLHLDADPYPVISRGRIVWVLDAYTTTDRYPYAQRTDTSQLGPGSGLDHKFNYVRNSVKAVVDAYDGTVDLYVMPGDDPIIEAYRDAFPKLFSDFDDMPADLKEHLRYPEDLFRIQTTAWARYHLTDPLDFYNRNDAWVVAQDPGTAGAGQATRPTDAQGNPIGPERSARIDPYYQLLRLPGEREPEFVLLRPFVPFSEDDSKQLLTAFMVARSDGENYGKLLVYEMPRGSLPDGPGIASASIQASQQVSELETLLGSAGSHVLYGNLILVPVDDALLYVQPFYVEAQSSTRQIPQLRKVIAVFGDDVVVADDLSGALQALFGEAPATPDDDGEEPPDELPTGTVDERVAALLADATRLFQQAEDALAKGDLGTYQKRNEAAQAKVAQAVRLLREGDGATGGTTSTTAPSSPTSSTSTTKPASA